MNPSTLTPFSLRFYERVCALRPEWRAHARPCEDEPGAVEFAFASPAGGNGRELIFTSAEEEFTWFYEYFHTHYPPWSEASEDQMTREAVDAIAAFMDEKTVIEGAMLNGEPMGSSLIAAGEVTEPGERAHMYTRSWRGTYDREYPPQPKKS